MDAKESLFTLSRRILFAILGDFYTYNISKNKYIIWGILLGLQIPLAWAIGNYYSLHDVYKTNPLLIADEFLAHYVNLHSSHSKLIFFFDGLAIIMAIIWGALGTLKKNASLNAPQKEITSSNEMSIQELISTIDKKTLENICNAWLKTLSKIQTQATLLKEEYNKNTIIRIQVYCSNIHSAASRYNLPFLRTMLEPLESELYSVKLKKQADTSEKVLTIINKIIISAREIQNIKNDLMTI